MEAVEGYMGNARCDLCQTEDLNEDEYYFHCEPCGFDACKGCALIIGD